MKINSADQQN